MELEISKELKLKIDSILEKLFSDGILSSAGSDELTLKAFRISKALGLIRLKSSPTTYELSEKGVFAIQDGGIEKYLENIRVEKDLDNQIRRLTKKRLEWEYGINFLFLILGALITFLVTKFSESDSQKQTIRKSNNLKLEMFDSISNNRILLNEQNIRLLDIKILTDSLKIKN